MNFFFELLRIENTRHEIHTLTSIFEFNHKTFDICHSNKKNLILEHRHEVGSINQMKFKSENIKINGFSSFSLYRFGLKPFKGKKI